MDIMKTSQYFENREISFLEYSLTLAIISVITISSIIAFGNQLNNLLIKQSPVSITLSK